MACLAQVLNPMQRQLRYCRHDCPLPLCVLQAASDSDGFIRTYFFDCIWLHGAQRYCELRPIDRQAMFR